jgi:two-component system, NarL family, nitrate/nitrite response regulator NarL
MSLRVMLVDDHALFRDAVAHVLAHDPNIQVVGAYDSVEQALEHVRQAAPDQVLLDYDLHGRRGTEFLRAAKERGYRGAVLIVTAGLPDHELQTCFDQGASGVFLKEQPLSVLLEAIRAVAEGRAWYNQRQLRIISLLNERKQEVTFTGRERDILRSVVEGLSNKQIADRLGVPETAVKAGVQRLFQKVGTRSRGSLVRIALEKYQDYLSKPGCS